jgi:carbon-monoxide dehydrogenase small subunit
MTLNGQPRSVNVYPISRLLDVLRDEFGLTGTKEGCGEGECGACSVIVNGELVNSCLIPIAQLEGAEVTTIEGISCGEKLHPVQQAFLECGGAQCGMCTPGMIVAAVQLLRKIPHPAPEEIREGLNGNLCRCTGYTRIFAAVQRAGSHVQDV